MKSRRSVALLILLGALSGAVPAIAQGVDMNDLDRMLKGPLPAEGSSLPASEPPAPLNRGVPATPALPTLDRGMPATQAPPPLRDAIPPADTSEPVKTQYSDKMPPEAPTFRRPNLSSGIAPNVGLLQQSVANFHVVTPGILRGGQPTTEDLAKLKAAGVKTIVDLRNEDVIVRQEASAAKAIGLTFVNIPMDVFNPPSQNAVNTFLKLTDDASKQPLYVHCLHGQDRTGTMVAIYRIERHGWNANQAYQEMLSCGFRPGFSRLSQAVFAYGAAAGRPGKPPSGADIFGDLQNRLSKNH